jgi:hypothetical protein
MRDLLINWRWGMLLLVVLSAIACLARAPTSSEAPPAPAPAQNAKEAVAAEPGSKAAAVPSALADMAAARKLIRTAEITIEVDDCDRVAQEVERIAQQLGGYVSDSHVMRSPSGQRAGRMTARVPAERLDDMLRQLRQLGRVDSEKVSTQDITKAYTDLETRLRVKRDASDRLRKILADRTAKLSDVLQVERELARITEESEQMEGERRFYDQQVALSTVSLDFAEPETLVHQGLGSKLKRVGARSLDLLGSSAVALLYFCVAILPWLVVIVPAIALFRFFWRRRKKPAAPPPAPAVPDRQ